MDREKRSNVQKKSFVLDINIPYMFQAMSLQKLLALAD